MARVEISESIRQETRKAIRDFTLFDDAFMSIVFDENPECTEFVLGVILGKKLKVVESRTQQQIKNLRGSSIRLDIKAVDSKDRLYNIEVQRESSGAKPRRARHNGSLLDANCKDAGRYGDLLPETYVIFITEKDYWKLGQPLYHVERKIAVGGKDVLFGDGLHIIYVNGAYKGNDKIGDLMHDFSCANPDNMKSAILRKSTAPYKNDEKEKQKMERAVDKLKKLVIEEDHEDIALKLLNKKVSIETIMLATGFSEARIRKLQESMRVVA